MTADPWQVITDVMSELLRGGQTADIRCRAALSVLERNGISFGKPLPAAQDAQEPAPDSEATEMRAVIDMIWRMCQHPKQAAGTSQGVIVNGERLAARIAGLIKNSGMEPF